MSVFAVENLKQDQVSRGLRPSASAYSLPFDSQNRTSSFSKYFKQTCRNSIVATSCLLLSTTQVFATLDNTATVTGTPRAGTLPSPIQASESVDLIDRVNTLTISKSAAITTDGDSDGLGDVGDVITYTYTIENTGNTTLTAVGVNDTHDGSAALTAPGFDSWTTQGGSPAATVGATAITLAPGAIAIFTTTYTLTSTDVASSGGGGTTDGDLDNSAVAQATSPGGTANDTVSTASVAAIPLDVSTSMNVAKAAYEGGVPASLGGTGNPAAADRPVGTVVTYVYTVTNDGNVSLTNVGVTDVHTGLGTLGTITYNSLTNTSGSSVYTSGNTVDTLFPGDVAFFTATYTITQADIDAQ